MILTTSPRSAVSMIGRLLFASVASLALIATSGLAQDVATAPVAPPPLVHPAPPPSIGEGPAMWVVRDADSTLYLFGTIHVLRPDIVWGSARVDAALAASSDVWFEIADPDDTAAIVALFQQYGVSPDRPLSGLLTMTEMGQLDAAARGMGSNISQFDPMRPWRAAIILSMAPFAKAGYDPGSSVELRLKAIAEAQGKTVHGFETAEAQVRLMATLPEDVQVEFLRSTLEDYDEATTEIDAMVRAWAIGDMAALDRVAVQEMKAESPGVYDALMVRRNVAFADGIEDLLAGSGTAFIAIGAAHFAGDESVLAELERRGVRPERQ